MQNYHNIRNSKGQFTRRLAVSRDADGKFVTPFEIVSGRLYNFKGSTVRALKKDTKTGTHFFKNILPKQSKVISKNTPSPILNGLKINYCRFRCNIQDAFR